MADIIQAVFGVFTEVGDWIATAIQSMTAIFYVPETGLTFVGVLALCGLAVGVTLLLINTIKDFIRFR